MPKSAAEVIAEVFSRCEADEELPGAIVDTLKSASQQGEWDADRIERSLAGLDTSK